MFFYPVVLNHRTGCFSTIWLAATKGKKLSRRELLKVNVYRTCCDIMDYLMVRVLPPALGLPRPRFSLYLSSQLNYGVVLVFHKQCDFLLEETQSAIDKFLRSSRKAVLDLTDGEARQRRMLPDPLCLFNETEGARDPLFGLMETEYDQLSPSRLMQQMMDVEPSSSPDGLTASKKTITMIENEPVTIPQPEFEGDELPDSNILDLLLDQQDYFPEGGDERQQEFAQNSEGSELERAARETPSDLEERRIDALHTGEEREKTPEILYESGPPPPPRSEEEAGLGSPEREKELMKSTGKKRKRRRQQIFVDAETQIPQEQMRAQTNDVETETRPLETVLVQPSLIDAKTLFRTPCTNLPSEILELWRKAAVVKPLPAHRRFQWPPAAEKMPDEEELSSAESMRELLSGLSQQDTPESQIVLETPDKDSSATSELRQLSGHATELGLQNIPEDTFPDEENVTIEDSRLQTGVEVTFHSLLPPQATRRDVAQTFWNLLEMVGTQMTAQQTSPYGVIIVTRCEKRSG